MADTLFYDASCPLCRREVGVLRSLAGPNLAFQDIHSADGDGVPSREALLKSLHLLRDDGEMLRGLVANVAVWQHTRFGLPWRLLLLPLIRPIAESMYNVWARRRYDRLYGCAPAPR